jgi:hypothetical protein
VREWGLEDGKQRMNEPSLIEPAPPWGDASTTIDRATHLGGAALLVYVVEREPVGGGHVSCHVPSVPSPSSIVPSPSSFHHPASRTQHPPSRFSPSLELGHPGALHGAVHHHDAMPLLPNGPVSDRLSGCSQAAKSEGGHQLDNPSVCGCCARVFFRRLHALAAEARRRTLDRGRRTYR